MEERDRFDKFTERAEKVLSLAQEEALRFQHNYIDTEHLLLGLVREGGGVAAQVLTSLGLTLAKARNTVEFIIGRGDRILLGEVSLTPRAKKVMELAVDEANHLNHHYIGTEHLLLGLVREGEGIAAGVLESLGLTLEQVRTATLRVLGIPAPSGVEAELARVEQLQKRIQAIIAVEGFTNDRPLVEQFEERVKELREQLAKEQQEREQGHAVEPKKPEEENE